MARVDRPGNERGGHAGQKGASMSSSLERYAGPRTRITAIDADLADRGHHVTDAFASGRYDDRLDDAALPGSIREASSLSIASVLEDTLRGELTTVHVDPSHSQRTAGRAPGPRDCAAPPGRPRASRTASEPRRAAASHSLPKARARGPPPRSPRAPAAPPAASGRAARTSRRSPMPHGHRQHGYSGS